MLEEESLESEFAPTSTSVLQSRNQSFRGGLAIVECSHMNFHGNGAVHEKHARSGFATAQAEDQRAVLAADIVHPLRALENRPWRWVVVRAAESSVERS